MASSTFRNFKAIACTKWDSWFPIVGVVRIGDRRSKESLSLFSLFLARTPDPQGGEPSGSAGLFQFSPSCPFFFFLVPHPFFPFFWRCCRNRGVDAGDGAGRPLNNGYG